MTTGIAIIGAGMIGAAHASGYRTLPPRVGLDARLATVRDMSGDQAGALARTWGFETVATDWRQVIADPAIGIVSVCLPNFLHGEGTRAALAAGKHVLCEKPLATTLSDARATRDAARGASGELGDPAQITVFYQCDYAADPLLPYGWRYEFERAGPGALLDVGTHAVDLARFTLGDVAEVAGAVSTISIPERFLPAEATVGHGHAALSKKTAKVESDDVTSAPLRVAGGAQGFVTASRVAVGTGNRAQVEVYGTRGTARFTNETPSHFDLAIDLPPRKLPRSDVGSARPRRSRRMRKSRFSETQIISMIKEQEAGNPAARLVAVADADACARSVAEGRRIGP